MTNIITVLDAIKIHMVDHPRPKSARAGKAFMDRMHDANQAAHPHIDEKYRDRTRGNALGLDWRLDESLGPDGFDFD